MKKIILMLGLGLGVAALAQPQPPTKPKAKEPMGDTEINSERVEYRPEFDANGGQLVYSGHVLVQNLRIKILCDRLVIFLPKNGDQPNRVEAQTNVVIIATNHGEPTRATCSLAVYTHSVTSGVTNAVVTLTGSPLPYVENARATTTGNPIIWNLTSGKIEGANNKTIIKMKALEGGTNTPGSSLF